MTSSAICWFSRCKHRKPAYGDPVTQGLISIAHFITVRPCGKHAQLQTRVRDRSVGARSCGKNKTFIKSRWSHFPHVLELSNNQISTVTLHARRSDEQRGLLFVVDYPGQLSLFSWYAAFQFERGPMCCLKWILLQGSVQQTNLQEYTGRSIWLQVHSEHYFYWIFLVFADLSLV